MCLILYWRKNQYLIFPFITVKSNSFYHEDECILLRSHSGMNVRFYYNQVASVMLDSSCNHKDQKELEEALYRYNIDDTFKFIHLFEANNERPICTIEFHN